MQENVSGYVVFSCGLCQCKKAVAPPVHVQRPYMFTTSTCSLPVHVHHRCLFTIQYMFITSVSSQPVHVHQQYMFTTSARLPPVRVRHRHMSTTSTCSSPVHVHHQHMSTTSARSPPVHVNHQYISTNSTCSLAGMGLKGQQREWRTCVKYRA